LQVIKELAQVPGVTDIQEEALTEDGMFRYIKKWEHAQRTE
jgi:hypothetical protein